MDVTRAIELFVADMRTVDITDLNSRAPAISVQHQYTISMLIAGITYDTSMAIQPVIVVAYRRACDILHCSTSNNPIVPQTIKSEQ